MSAYVKSNSNSEGSVYLQAMNIVNEEYVEVNFEPAVSNDGSEWERLSITFTVPEERTYPWTFIYLMFDSTKAISAVFDCMQLEESTTVTPYNFVDNGSFEFNSSGIPDFWTESYIQHDENSYASGQKFGKAVTIDGEPENIPGMWQLCHVTATEKNTFIISGWGKAKRILPPGSDQAFRHPLKVVLVFSAKRRSLEFISLIWHCKTAKN